MEKRAQCAAFLRPCRSTTSLLGDPQLRRQRSCRARSAPPRSPRCRRRPTWHARTPSAQRRRPPQAARRSQQPGLRSYQRAREQRQGWGMQPWPQPQPQHRRLPARLQHLPAARLQQRGGRAMAAPRSGRSSRRRRRTWWSSGRFRSRPCARARARGRRMIRPSSGASLALNSFVHELHCWPSCSSSSTGSSSTDSRIPGGRSTSSGLQRMVQREAWA